MIVFTKHNLKERKISLVKQQDRIKDTFLKKKDLSDRILYTNRAKSIIKKRKENLGTLKSSTNITARTCARRRTRTQQQQLHELRTAQSTQLIHISSHYHFYHTFPR